MFAEIFSKIEIHLFSDEPDGEILEESYDLFLKFVRGEFEI
jgi:hypothetical protein